MYSAILKPTDREAAPRMQKKCQPMTRGGTVKRLPATEIQKKKGKSGGPCSSHKSSTDWRAREELAKKKDASSLDISRMGAR